MNQTKMEVKKSTDNDDDKIIDGEVYYYCSLEDALCESHRITNKKTGVTVELDSDQKLMYMRMRKRFHFFNSKEKPFYDNVDVLSDAAGVNLRTFHRKMPGLVEVGLIEKDDSLKSNSYRLAYLTPDDFLLERKDKKLGWVDCLEYPVFGSKRPQEAPKVEVQETEAVTETSPQEPQQPETNPALPSSDDIHTSADSLSDDVPKPTGKVNLIFKPYNPEKEEDENYAEDEEEEEELEYWERVDESPPSKIKPSSISLAMRNQLYPQRKSEKGDYSEHIPF
ncbi:hypothetical protein PU656_18680 [Klebsiella pneumoniae]|uniref:DUF6945 domain-containing protein n=1 Tax=Klebsiella pneumoniae TaxID=573 RepID=UPI0037526355